jgi:predicted Rdx family selenoprotein
MLILFKVIGLLKPAAVIAANVHTFTDDDALLTLVPDTGGCQPTVIVTIDRKHVKGILYICAINTSTRIR